MFRFSKAALLPLSALIAVCALAGLPAAHAQIQPPAVQRADPTDPQAVTPRGVYRSSLSRYQAFAETDVAPWRETNERVRQRGGWRAYAREASEPASTTPASPPAPAASKPAASVKPAKPGHAGHEME